MLQPRTEVVLKTIVQKYVESAEAVSSAEVLSRSGLQVSPATIRNEMAQLADEGYIIRPHYASGCIPSDRGYRYYVSTLKDVGLPEEDERLLSHLFYQIEQDPEEWLDLAVSFLAQRTRVMALATAPRTSSSRFKHLELVGLRQHLVLVVLVLWSTEVMRELLRLKREVDHAELAAMADKLNGLYYGMDRHEIESTPAELTEEERMVSRSVLRLMEIKDLAGYGEPYLDGWAFLVSQPEFSHSERLARLMDLVGQRKLLRVILPEVSAGSGVSVVIGAEHKDVLVRDYAMVMGRYGLPGTASGYLGVIGPTRIFYERAIAAVEGVISVLNRLLGSLYDKNESE